MALTFAEAGLFVQVHTMAALGALVLGGWQLLRPKGGAFHRFLGYGWVGLMLVVAVSSFWIRGIMLHGPFAGFSPIHLLSMLTLVMLVWGVLAARQRQFSRHRKIMMGVYFGGLVLAELFTLLPGRLLSHILFGF